MEQYKSTMTRQQIENFIETQNNVYIIEDTNFYQNLYKNCYLFNFESTDSLISTLDVWNKIVDCKILILKISTNSYQVLYKYYQNISKPHLTVLKFKTILDNKNNFDIDFKFNTADGGVSINIYFHINNGEFLYSTVDDIDMFIDEYYSLFDTQKYLSELFSESDANIKSIAYSVLFNNKLTLYDSTRTLTLSGTATLNKEDNSVGFSIPIINDFNAGILFVTFYLDNGAITSEIDTKIINQQIKKSLTPIEIDVSQYSLNDLLNKNIDFDTRDYDLTELFKSENKIFILKLENTNICCYKSYLIASGESDCNFTFNFTDNNGKFYLFEFKPLNETYFRLSLISVLQAPMYNNINDLYYRINYASDTEHYPSDVIEKIFEIGTTETSETVTITNILSAVLSNKIGIYINDYYVPLCYSSSNIFYFVNSKFKLRFVFNARTKTLVISNNINSY